MSAASHADQDCARNSTAILLKTAGASNGDMWPTPTGRRSIRTSSAAWTAEAPSGAPVRPIPRGWEIAGIVLGFVFAWPAALAYLVWKCAGYPLPDQARVPNHPLKPRHLRLHGVLVHRRCATYRPRSR